MHRHHPHPHHARSLPVRLLHNPTATATQLVHALAFYLLPLAAIVVAGIALVLVLRLRARRRLAEQGVCYRLRLPEQIDRERFAQVLAALAASLRTRRQPLARPYLGLELRVEGGDVEPLLYCSGGLPAQRLANTLLEAFPGMQLTAAPVHRARAPSGSCWRSASLRHAGRMSLPLDTNLAADPAALTLRTLAAAGDGEGGVVQLLFAAAPTRAKTRLLAEAMRLRSGKPRRDLLDLILDAGLAVPKAALELFDSTPPIPRGSAPTPGASAADLERARALEAKAREPLFACTLRLATWAPEAALAASQLDQLAAAYAQYSGLGALRRGRERDRLARLFRRQLPGRPPLLLAASELAALAPLPEQTAQAPLPFEQAPARQLAPIGDAPRDGLLLGHSHARGRPEPLYLSVEALLQHAHLLGPTGSGKSTLLLALAVQLATLGYGVALVEPKGDLADEFLARIPAERVEQVVLLDFGDPSHPPACNLLAGIGNRGQVEAVSEIFSRLFHAHWGPRSDDLLRAALATLVSGATPDMPPTLADVLPLLTNPARRGNLGELEGVVLAGFWRSWEQTSESARQQALAPLANKLRAFLLREPLRDALVQPEAPDLRSVIADGRILVCSLPKQALWEDGAALLGSVLLHRLWQAAQALGPARGRRPPFICLVDEFHSFSALPGGMADTLSEARGYGLGFLLAHQQLAQLTPELREAVAVNCRSKLCFQLDPPDHERMARHYRPRLEADDLLRLDAYQLAARLLHQGRVLPAATATAAPTDTGANGQTAAAIRQHTHAAMRTKAQVDELIRARFPQITRPARGPVAGDDPHASERPSGRPFGRSTNEHPNEHTEPAPAADPAPDPAPPRNSDRSQPPPSLLP